MVSPTLRQFVLAAVILGLLTLVTHGLVVNNGYALDAVLHVELNPHVKADASLVEIFSTPLFSAEDHPGRGLYRPMTVLSFHLTRLIWNEPVVPVDHAIDLALHVLCGLAVVAFLGSVAGRQGGISHVTHASQQRSASSCTRRRTHHSNGCHQNSTETANSSQRTQ